MSQAFHRFDLPVYRRLPLEANPVCIQETADGGYLLNFSSSPEVIKLDQDLNELWRQDLQAQTMNYVSCILTVSRDEEMIALSGFSDIRIFSKEGNLLWTHSHRGWAAFLGSACFFAADGLIIWFVLPGNAENDNDVLYAIHVADFSIKATLVMDGNQEFSYAFQTSPDSSKILIDVAAGQESGMLYLAQLKNDVIVLEQLTQCDDRIFGAFSPAGTEFVTAPHYDEGIEIFSFPEISRITTMEQQALFAGRNEYPSEEDEDSLDYVVLYINSTTLLAFTRFGRLLLIDRQRMVCTGELIPGDCEIKAFDMAGRPTTDPEKIIDYAGEIVTVDINRKNQLVVTHHSGELRLYNLPVAFNQ